MSHDLSVLGGPQTGESPVDALKELAEEIRRLPLQDEFKPIEGHREIKFRRCGGRVATMIEEAVIAYGAFSKHPWLGLRFLILALSKNRPQQMQTQAEGIQYSLSTFEKSVKWCRDHQAETGIEVRWRTNGRADEAVFNGCAILADALEAYADLLAGVAQSDAAPPLTSPIPWKVLKDARREVSMLKQPCTTLREVEHELIEAMHHCYRVSRIKVQGAWSFDDARNVSTAFWFFHDRWAGLRTEIQEVLAGVEWQDMPVAEHGTAIQIFPNLGEVSIDSALKMGLHTADVVLSNYFRGQCELPVEKMDEISPETQELMGRDVASCAAKLQAELGEISRTALDAWTRTFKTELRAMARAREERQRSAKHSASGKSPSDTKESQGQSRQELDHWTQKDLDKAIREYKAERSSSYGDLVEARRRNTKNSLKAARKVFGRNAIAKALRVRSPIMVSRSPAFRAIAEELKLPLNRVKVTGTRNTAKAGRVGLNIAVDEASEGHSDDQAPDTELMLKEARETERLIRQLPAEEAGPILEKYQDGEITDEQARQMVKTLMAN